MKSHESGMHHLRHNYTVEEVADQVLSMFLTGILQNPARKLGVTDAE